MKCCTPKANPVIIVLCSCLCLLVACKSNRATIRESGSLQTTSLKADWHVYDTLYLWPAKARELQNIPGSKDTLLNHNSYPGQKQESVQAAIRHVHITTQMADTAATTSRASERKKYTSTKSVSNSSLFVFLISISGLVIISLLLKRGQRIT